MFARRHAGEPGLRLSLVSIGPVEPGLLQDLAAALVGSGFDVDRGAELPVPGDVFDAARRQWRAEPLLALLACQPGDHIVGVTELDLYAEGVRFSFGIGQRPGKAALVSLCHLREGSDPARVLERALKECLHELGHALGLPHCTHRRCVMLSSNELSDTDRKRSEPCPRCARAFLRALADHGARGSGSAGAAPATGRSRGVPPGPRAVDRPS